MCIPTFKCVYHVCIPTFSSFIVLRAQFPSPSFPCGLKAPSNGETHLCHIQPWSNGNALGCRTLGRWIGSWSDGGAAAILAAPGFEPPLHYHSAAAYAEANSSPHCLEPCLPLTKKGACYHSLYPVGDGQDFSFFFHGLHVSHVYPRVVECVSCVYPKNKKCVSRANADTL